MSTTLFHESTQTRTWEGHPATRCSDELLAAYAQLVSQPRLSWTTHHRLIRLLGEGGQGVVYLSQRRGTDDFALPIALKMFSPDRFAHDRAYDEAMAEMAKVAARVARIQQDNLLHVHNWIDRHRIRIMEMEWVDGYDLARLLNNRMLDHLYQRVSTRRWNYINEVIVTRGPVQPRLKPGVAMAIIRDCLAALASIHREGIVHGDLKPSNIMLKRTGTAKIIDIGAAFEVDRPPSRRTCTPTYAAPEVLEVHQWSPRSDLASLGYVLIEMLAGIPPFAGRASVSDLLEAKRFLAQRLHQILPGEVTCNDLLMNFIRGMIAPDPMRRFPSAEAADLFKEGAASFQRQLVKGDLASEYHNEIRIWMEELEQFEQSA